LKFTSRACYLSMAESDTRHDIDTHSTVIISEDDRGVKRKLGDTGLVTQDDITVQNPSKKFKLDDLSCKDDTTQSTNDFIFSNISNDSSWQDQSFSLSRSRNNQNNRQGPKKRKKKINNGQKWFQYGNYPDYYDYRTKGLDPRINALKKEWFENKKCLDIGCNSGKFTIDVGK